MCSKGDMLCLLGSCPDSYAADTSSSVVAVRTSLSPQLWHEQYVLSLFKL